VNFRAFSIRAKVLSIVVIAAVGLGAVGGVALNYLYDAMLASRALKTQHIVQVGTTLLGFYAGEAKAGRMTETEAQHAAMLAVKALRYGDNEYLWINDLQPRVLMHPMKPELDGQDVSALKDPTGKALFVEFANTVKKSGAGFVYYLWPKPGASDPVRKVSYVQGFPAWGWVIGSGIYLDDFQAEFWETALMLGVIMILVAAGALAAATVVARSTANPIRLMTGVMHRLAEGDTAVQIPHNGRSDEIGDMAAAVQVFRDNMIQSERLAAEQKAEQARKERRQAAIEAAIVSFEGTVTGALGALGSASSELATTARLLTDTADQTSHKATAVAAASEEASVNVQTVASATEELSASVAEIGRQVAQSTQITSQAVDEAIRTNGDIKGLAEAAQRIGDVVKLINDIAGQTNLLALNATIEASRAGEAGKGFAVVASEVKSLANQTARATEDIGKKIGEMQTATGHSVRAIETIGQTIGRINEISTTIAAAVEEQGAATVEIARNVQEAASGTTEVSSSIVAVTQGAGATGDAAKQVRDSAAQLSRQGDILRQEVDRFLASIRAA